MNLKESTAVRTQRLQLAQPRSTRDTITQFTNFRIRKKRFLTNAHHLSPDLMRIHTDDAWVLFIRRGFFRIPKLSEKQSNSYPR